MRPIRCFRIQRNASNTTNLERRLIRLAADLAARVFGGEDLCAKRDLAADRKVFRARILISAISLEIFSVRRGREVNGGLRGGRYSG